MIKNLKIPEIINKEKFFSMKRKDQDFVLMLFSRKYTKSEIMDHFYLESRQAYNQYCQRVKKNLGLWQ